MEATAEDRRIDASIAVLDLSMRTQIKFGRDEEGQPKIHFTPPSLRYFTVDSTAPPTVVRAALYVGQLYMRGEQRSSELRQAASDSRVARSQRVMEDLQQDSNSSTPEPEKSDDKYNELTTLSTAIEELVPVLRLMYYGDCAGKIFDRVVYRIGAQRLFTTDYVPLE